MQRGNVSENPTSHPRFVQDAGAMRRDGLPQFTQIAKNRNATRQIRLTCHSS